MKRIIVILPFLSLFTSCEKEIPLNAELTDPKLVVNCAFEKGGMWNVHVSQSLSVVDKGSLTYVEGATVNLLNANGTLIETLTDHGFGLYSSPTAQVGNTGTLYKIEVSKPGFTAVTAQDIVPFPAMTTFVDSASNIYLGDQVFEIRFDIHDPSQTNNYYLIEMDAYGSDDFGNPIHYDLWFNVNAPEFDTYNPEAYEQTAYLKDDLINGSSYRVTTRVGQGLIKNGQIDSVGISLISCTQAAYDYTRTYESFWQASGDFFAQPVQVYSNVENGFGIFAGYTRREIILEL